MQSEIAATSGFRVEGPRRSRVASSFGTRSTIETSTVVAPPSPFPTRGTVYPSRAPWPSLARVIYRPRSSSSAHADPLSGGIDTLEGRGARIFGARREQRPVVASTSLAGCEGGSGSLTTAPGKRTRVRSIQGCVHEERLVARRRSEVYSPDAMLPNLRPSILVNRETRERIRCVDDDRATQRRVALRRRLPRNLPLHISKINFFGAGVVTATRARQLARDTC